MNEQVSPSEYLVISRGQWDKDLSRQEIQNAIDQFYVWLGRLVDEGKMKTGQRLGNAGKTVSRKNVVTDGPFGEVKEVIGGYLFIVAGSLGEAAKIAPGNPCVKCGFFFQNWATLPEAGTGLTADSGNPNEQRKQTSR